MEKGSGTRSGLLWEVERLLNECAELPQILLMENVPQVHGKKNKEHFDKWIEFLKSKGYSNYWQDLNAKDYGIPQSRNRCYMVSILGEYTYNFPEPVPITLKLANLLEDNVDHKYFLRPEKTRKLLNIPKDKHGPTLLDNRAEYARTITTRIASHGNFEQYIVVKNDTLPILRTYTPIECWRLMGFDDVDFNKAKKLCCDSQLYKQAGNSIVVNVLMAIFKELFVPKQTRSEWLDELLK
jgi:DNA (cytosine-5)-methyltransferase 1